MSFFADIASCLRPRCPVCRVGKLFKPWSLMLVDKCANCGEPLAANDVGDGAAVFVIFLLGFGLVPLAWIFENIVHPPLWVHVVLWGPVALALIAVLLPAVKAYILLLERRHRR